MTARRWVEINRRDGVEKRHVNPQGDIGVADGACPGCKASPFVVLGANRRIHDDAGTYIADGYCRACGDPVGYIYALVATIFGLTEDRNMLEFARCRVY